MALPSPDLLGLALFAGGAGLELGISRFLADVGRASRTVAFVEREAYAAAVLVSRMEEGRLDPAPVWSDVATFDGRPWRGVVDFIAGGFPCQDISNAGQRAGIIDGERSGLWREYARIIGEVRPRFVFVENVRPLLVRGIDSVLGDLAALGFDAEWCNLRASDVGAPHVRDRLFLLAYANGRLQAEQPRRVGGARGSGATWDRGGGEALGDAGCPQWREDAPAGSGGELGSNAGREATSLARQPGDAVADAGDGLVPESWRGAEGRARARPTSAALADADGSGQRPRGGRGREPGGVAEPEHGSIDVGDAMRAGLEESERAGEHLRARSTLERSGSVADADASGLGRGSELRAREPVAIQRGELVADATSLWLGEGGKLDAGRDAAGSGSTLGTMSWVPWPPGPRDVDGWRAYLEQYPDLAPAVERAPRAQSELRRSSHGMADILVLRVDRLRLLGNGVVPAQAAAAFRILAARNPEIERALMEPVACCACGRAFTAAEWAALPSLGTQKVEPDWSECDCGSQNGEHKPGCAGRGYTLLLANCACGSTITKEIEAPACVPA